MYETPRRLVNCVVKDKKKEVLIPALESVVIDIDLELKRMRVDLPEGLV